MAQLLTRPKIKEWETATILLLFVLPVRKQFWKNQKHVLCEVCMSLTHARCSRRSRVANFNVKQVRADTPLTWTWSQCLVSLLPFHACSELYTTTHTFLDENFVDNIQESSAPTAVILKSCIWILKQWRQLSMGFYLQWRSIQWMLLYLAKHGCEIKRNCLTTCQQMGMLYRVSPPCSHKRITPIPKVDQPKSEEHFRPISILPTLSKVFEKLVALQMSTFCESESVLRDTIPNFRKGQSTNTVLMGMRDELLIAMKKGEVTLMVPVDFSKAFDTVNYKILITQLSTLGFSKLFLRWSNSYLSDRWPVTFRTDRWSYIWISERTVWCAARVDPRPNVI